MKIIYNKLIPFKGFVAMTVWPFIFIRSECRDYVERYPQVINHEEIHGAQQKELLLIFFYICYLAEWIYRLIFHPKTAYKGISFEREAYEHEREYDYLDRRKPFAMWRKNSK